MKYVIGLDLSMRKTGVAVLDIDGNLIMTRLIKPRASLDHGMKLLHQAQEMRKFRYKFKPQIVGIEQGFTRFNTSTQVVFRVHGVANYVFCHHCQEYFTATTVKKSFTGNGKATKEDMIKKVFDKYGIEVSEDEADAIAVAELALKEYKKVNK